ncbi:unnamed protein product [Nippostrongylus brasiliensis]|uniref:Dystrophin n=1 Tax=Nippostrongylus brasiliensis TaxID=27835 RepID=A0A0N4XS10_NIPBR|nr:unnamed protein product [Nippostrongylus brasiliensis]
MNVLEWSDEEVHDWLRQFSLLLDDVVQKGSRSTREDIVELLMAITSFNEGLQQSGRFTQNVTTLKVAQELLSAALVQHDRNVSIQLFCFCISIVIFIVGARGTGKRRY